MNKKEEYLALLSKNYDEAVGFLLKKYGPAEDDYFSEKSYERFLIGEIKNITRGKYSRSAEGLECHHIDENKFLNISNKDFIKDQSISFEYHKKEKLIFCDVIEHAILHTLIAKETSLNLGYPGYIVFLRPKIQEWYLDKIIPRKSKHHIACYHTAYVEANEASELLEKMDNILSAEAERLHQEKQERIKKVIQKGNFKKINKCSPRLEIVHAMYDLKKIGASGYSRIYFDYVYSEEVGLNMPEPVEFQEFERRVEDYGLNGIVKNIHLYINYVEGEMNQREYTSQANLYSKTKEEIRVEKKAKKRAQKEKEKLEKQERLKREEFYSTYPNFEKIAIDYNVKRQEVNALLFKYSDKYPSFIKFQLAMKKYSLNQLLEKLHTILKE